MKKTMWFILCLVVVLGINKGVIAADEWQEERDKKVFIRAPRLGNKIYSFFISPGTKIRDVKRFIAEKDGLRSIDRMKISTSKNQNHDNDEDAYVILDHRALLLFE